MSSPGWAHRGGTYEQNAIWRFPLIANALNLRICILDIAVHGFEADRGVGNIVSGFDGINELAANADSRRQFRGSEPSLCS
jgi:hypothetical protein